MSWKFLQINELRGSANAVSKPDTQFEGAVEIVLFNPTDEHDVVGSGSRDAMLRLSESQPRRL